MPAYLFSEVEITNSAKYGGRAAELPEDDPELTIIVVGIPNTAPFDRWWNSSEHQARLPSRRENSTGRLQDAEAQLAHRAWLRTPIGQPDRLCHHLTSAE